MYTNCNYICFIKNNITWKGMIYISNLRDVLILVSNIKTPDKYLAKSYPTIDKDYNGKMELYNVPVYKVFIKGTDSSNNAVVIEWKALRFMPYFNDPNNPSRDYKTLGWANSGLHSLERKAVTLYKPDYLTHNRYSPSSGAIVMRGTFYIHAGPRSITDHGWGAAGCVEIIGDFDNFKNDIRKLSGSDKTDLHDAILELVSARKLYVKVDYAEPPNIKADYWGEVRY